LTSNPDILTENQVQFGTSALSNVVSEENLGEKLM